VSCVLTHIRFFATASTTLPSRKQPEEQDVRVGVGLNANGSRGSGVGGRSKDGPTDAITSPTPDPRPPDSGSQQRRSHSRDHFSDSRLPTPDSRFRVVAKTGALRSPSPTPDSRPPTPNVLNQPEA